MIRKAKTRVISLSAAFFTFFFAAVFVNAEEWVKFQGTTTKGEALKLKGILNVPQGEGPFAAGVMLCGSGGLKQNT